MTDGDKLLLELDYYLVGETKYEALFKNEEHGTDIHLHFDKKRKEFDYYLLEPFYNFTALPIGSDLMKAIETKVREYGWNE